VAQAPAAGSHALLPKYVLDTTGWQKLICRSKELPFGSVTEATQLPAASSDLVKLQT